jgi:hypothetical protein
MQKECNPELLAPSPAILLMDHLLHIHYPSKFDVHIMLGKIEIGDHILFLTVI